MQSLVFVLFLLFSLELCFLQKPNTDSNRRHDVYIAGFFPYGRGVENSETGLIAIKLMALGCIVLEFKVAGSCRV